MESNLRYRLTTKTVAFRLTLSWTVSLGFNTLLVCLIPGDDNR